MKSDNTNPDEGFNTLLTFNSQVSLKQRENEIIENAKPMNYKDNEQFHWNTLKAWKRKNVNFSRV